MIKKMLPKFRVVIWSYLIPVGLSQSLYASQEIQNLFARHYKITREQLYGCQDGSKTDQVSCDTLPRHKLDDCKTCHAPAIKDGLNNYGLLLRILKTPEGQLNFSDRDLEKADCDKDGINNSDEISAGTFPGSQDSEGNGIFVFPANHIGKPKNPVTFNHFRHVTDPDYPIKGNCDLCHDSSPGIISFPKVLDTTVSLKKTAHEVCFTCHNDSKKNQGKYPKSCNECHLKN